MDLRGPIAVLLEREGITQSELASRASVSQSTVSRAAKGVRVRRGAAHIRLCRYMQQYASTHHAPPDPVLDAIRETWDGSEAHAAALAKLIRASGCLWPTLGKETSP